jgi:hypothetical protein
MAQTMYAHMNELIKKRNGRILSKHVFYIQYLLDNCSLDWIVHTKIKMNRKIGR